MKRLWVLVAVVVIGAAAGGLAAVVAHKPDRQRVVDACHAAIRKEPGATGPFSDEDVAIPDNGSYVVTGLLSRTVQWSCSATVRGGVVRITGAEIRQ